MARAGLTQPTSTAALAVLQRDRRPVPGSRTISGSAASSEPNAEALLRRGMSGTAERTR
jgi:hypothetical protein